MARANKTIKPTKCIAPSTLRFNGFLLIPSIIANTILEPSSAGNGKTFIIPIDMDKIQKPYIIAGIPA